MEDKARARHRAFRNIAITFAVLTVLLLGVVAYTAFSEAFIRVRVGEIAKEVTYRVTVAEERIDRPVADMAVKGSFFEVTDTETDTFIPATTGERTGKAGGVVTLHNETDRSQPLVATTRLLTEGGVLFRIKTAVRVPANGTVDAVVEADADGKETEIGPSKFTIPGLNKTLQASIYGVSKAVMVRGATSERTVTNTDIENARAELKKRLTAKAKASIVAQSSTVSDQDIITSIIEEKISAKPGDRVQSFTAQLKANSVAVVFDRSALLKAIEKQAPGVELGNNNVLTYTLVNFDPIVKTVTLSGKATAGKALDRNSSIFSPVNFVGMTPEQVESFLENYEGVESVEVKVSPYWQHKLPRVPQRIKVQFE